MLALDADQTDAALP